MATGSGQIMMRNDAGRVEPESQRVRCAQVLGETEPGNGTRRKKVLAVSSGGGHWVQMMRLTSVLCAHDVVFATVNKAYGCDVPGAKVYAVVDATAWNKLKLLLQAIEVLLILLRVRPDVVVSTGAAPGYFAIRLGKLLGARTIWIDSIANVERLSMSGARIGEYADLWLTQWPHLALDSGPAYRGAVV